MPFGNWLSIPALRLSLHSRSGSGLARTPPSSASLTRFFCGRYLIRIPSGSFFCERSETFESGAVSYPNYLDWRAAQRGFTDLAFFGAIAPIFPPNRRGHPNGSARARDLELFRNSRVAAKAWARFCRG